MKDNIKKQRGITLIALIVTIIVLIILAAVGISMLLGDNGMTEKARWSEFVTEYEKVDEAKKLYMTEHQINKLGDIDPEFPIIRGDEGYVDIGSVKPTLKGTFQAEGLNIKRKKEVNLYKVDLTLLGDMKVKRNYVINIANGNLYSLKQVLHQGLFYHTPRRGVEGDAGASDNMIYYLPGYEKEGVQVQTQAIDSDKITLKKVYDDLGFKPEGQFFSHWVIDEQEDDEEEEETAGNIYGDGDTIDLVNDRLTDQDIYLKAVWSDGVRLNATEGKIGGQSIKIIEVVDGDQYGEKLETPIREGYRFIGWYTTEKNGGMLIEKDTQYDANVLINSTLYARWIDDIPPEEFRISVSDLTSEGFTMNLSREEDYGSRVKEVKYYVSDTKPNLNTLNGDSQSENTVTGLTKDMTKYVCATITDNAGNTRESTNYVKVWTGHDHDPDPEGSCFANVEEIHDLKKGAKASSAMWNRVIKCTTCGVNVNGGYVYRYIGQSLGCNLTFDGSEEYLFPTVTY